MKKKSLVLLLLSSYLGMAHADNQMLQIWQTDGQMKTINLSDEPVTTFADGNLVVTTKVVTITLPLQQVKKYTYASSADGIENVKNESVMIAQNGESITFHGMKSGTEIDIYSTSGRLMKQHRAEQDNVTVTVSDLPVGVYAVKANGVTYKIVKR